VALLVLLLCLVYACSWLLVLWILVLCWFGLIVVVLLDYFLDVGNSVVLDFCFGVYLVVIYFGGLFCYLWFSDWLFCGLRV